MKKFTALLLALTLCLGLTVTAMAVTYEPYSVKTTDYYGSGNEVTISFEAAYTETVTVPMFDWETDSQKDTEITMVTAKPGSQVTLTGAEYLDLYFYVESKVGDGYSDPSPIGWPLRSGTIEEIWEFGKKLLKEGYRDYEGTVLLNLTGEIYLKFDTNASSETPAEAPAFTDVAADSPYAPAIAWAVKSNITTGKTATTFAPKETCNTAQILTFLWRAKGAPAATGETPFTDVTNTSAYYYDAALWAAEKGLVSGSTFGEKSPCTRAAVVTYLWKLAGSPEMEASSTFTDVAADAEYAQAVAWAVENGITTGTSATTFGPSETCTRGQIVTFLYRAYAN